MGSSPRRAQKYRSAAHRLDRDDRRTNRGARRGCGRSTDQRDKTRPPAVGLAATRGKAARGPNGYSQFKPTRAAGRFEFPIVRKMRLMTMKPKREPEAEPVKTPPTPTCYICASARGPVVLPPADEGDPAFRLCLTHSNGIHD